MFKRIPKNFVIFLQKLDFLTLPGGSSSTNYLTYTSNRHINSASEETFTL